MQETLQDLTDPGGATSEWAPRAADSSPEAFWDHKILGWEQSAYGPAPLMPIARLLHHLRSSIRARLHMAENILRPYLDENSHLIDLGCGSGILGEHILNTTPARYTGVDISGVACAQARARLTTFEKRGRVIHEDATQLPLPADAIVVGLGFLDWLDAPEIEALGARLAGRKFLLSFSEESNSMAARIHRLWLVRRTQLMNAPSQAHHYTEQFVADALSTHAHAPLHLVRHPHMRFGVFVTNLVDARGEAPPT